MTGHMHCRHARRNCLHRPGTVLVALAIMTPFLRCADCTSAEADFLERGRWTKRSARTVGDISRLEEHDGVGLSKYGGWAARRTDATGFFHARQIDGRWWLVDPEGCLFISIGLCSVNLTGFDAAEVERAFGSKPEWAEATGRLLHSCGFNTLGCWSLWRDFRGTPQKMPYTPRWNFMLTYKNRRRAENGQRGYPNECMPVFDADFATFCDEHAKQLAEMKDDPWLLGHFSDNELPFRPKSLDNYLGLPQDDVGYKEAKQWLEARRGGGTDAARRLSDEDRKAFLEHLALRYYSTVGTAIRKYDPNHLYLGSRIHGRTICEPVFRGSRPVDVVSVNYYHRWSAEQGRMSNWVRWSGRPFIVSEWYAMSLQSVHPPPSGAGFRVRTDRDRGIFYQNLTLGLLEHPGCLGWHWFKYGGDGPNFHKGVVSGEFRPHEDLLKLMKELNAQAYPLRGD